MNDLIRIAASQPGTTILPGMTSPAFYLQLLDQLEDGVYFVDRERRILLWNSAAERLTGYAAGEVVGRTCFDQLLDHTGEDGSSLCGGSCPLKATIVDGDARECRVHLRHKRGHRLPVQVRARALVDDQGQRIGAVETFKDMSEHLASVALVESLEAAAYVDPLTGVGNRRYTEIKLRDAVSQTRRLGWPAALLFADIDRFKRVNDTYGHCAGDAVLRTVADTLAKNLRSFDFVGRWGGEEFVLLICGVTDDLLLAIANRLRGLVEGSSTAYQEHRISVTISVGATSVHPADTPATVVERADRLQYIAKKHRNMVVTDQVESSVEHHVMCYTEPPLVVPPPQQFGAV